MESILNNIQECINAHDNCITGEGLRMGEFTYASFDDLKDEVLKEIPWGGLGVFLDAWYLCSICNMDYTSETSFLERVKKFQGANFKSCKEACVASTFDQ